MWHSPNIIQSCRLFRSQLRYNRLMLETNKAIKMLCKKSKQNKLVRQKIEHVFYLEKVAKDEEGGVVATNKR